MDTGEFEGVALQKRKQTNTSVVCARFLVAVALVLAVPLTRAGASTQEQQKAPIGSLTSTGEVYVNKTQAPPESTIFAGDSLHTGEGSATFTMSGRGDLKISRQTELVFSDGSQYAAELKSGTVILDSSNGPSGVTLLAGGYVVVPAVHDQVTSARIDGPNKGSFRVSSLNGTVAIVDMQGNSGRVLQSGESASISTQGVSATPTPAVSSGHQKRWILLGVAGGGAVAGIAAAAAHGGGKQSVSPSSP